MKTKNKTIKPFKYLTDMIEIDKGIAWARGEIKEYEKFIQFLEKIKM